ncbi:MAG: hypothetical protein H0U57_05140 [Tatlockia sp.]|nr:hypothetical protein [Tatlockia sp.]
MINFKCFSKFLSFLFLMCLGYQTLAKAHSHSQQPSINLSVEKIINEKGKKTIIFKLTDAKTNQPITLNDLTEVHTQKIHMLIIDDSLSDYSHVHPTAASEPGVYYFAWQPLNKNANYRIWADLVPKKTKKQEYVLANLYQSKLNLVKVNTRNLLEANVNGYYFKLSFEQPKLVQGRATMGKIEVSNAQGTPLKSLEPLMGAYAHIVGFSEDFESVVHIHPMGLEPKVESDRGGPGLVFHIEPNKAGFIKLFAQVKINGREYFAPFGLRVEPNNVL